MFNSFELLFAILFALERVCESRRLFCRSAKFTVNDPFNANVIIALLRCCAKKKQTSVRAEIKQRRIRRSFRAWSTIPPKMRLLVNRIRPEKSDEVKRDWRGEAEIDASIAMRDEM